MNHYVNAHGSGRQERGCEFPLARCCEASSALHKARYAAGCAQSPFAHAWVGAADGHLAMAVGDYELAYATLLQQFEVTSRALGYASSSLTLISLLLSETCYALGNVEGAIRYLKFGLPHIHDHGIAESAAAGFRVIIRTRAHRQGPESAMAATLECARMGRADSPRLALMLLYEQICLALRHGDLIKATELAGFDGEKFSNNLLDAPQGEREMAEMIATLAKIRVLVACRQADCALRIIAPSLTWASRTKRRGMQVELLILRARAEQAVSKTDRACRTLLEAIVEAARCGMVQIFLDEGASLHALLNAVVPMVAQRPEVSAQFVAAIAPHGTHAPRAKNSEAALTTIDSLSPREIQILQMLDSGLTNGAVAAQLFLALRTVKWYLCNIYPKLGVKNRTSALARARKLGLL